jgi:ribosomal protein S18 acetylase RimI-like enzyme
MRVRRAELVDLNACVDMDRSYSTDFVWQVEERPRPDEIAVTFRKVRLPRTAQIRVPRQESGLLACWQQDECFVVAENQNKILGFLNMPIVPSEPVAHIRHLTVDSVHRRKGVGSAVLTSVAAWAREQGVLAITAEAETRNHPAISFLQKRGFTFCGYRDQLAVNQGILLFFILPLR